METEYLTKDRMVSYYNQTRIIKSLGKEINSILEIGIFKSLFTKILTLNGYQVMTADYNPDLQPDFLVDLRDDFSLPKNTFDAIVAFQVLEHIPYENFEIAFGKLVEATKKFVLISLPYNTQFFALQIKAFDSTNRPRHLLWQIPKFWETVPICDEHCWEMGMKNYPKSRIIASLQKQPIKIKREFQDSLNPYHYFFVLEKV